MLYEGKAYLNSETVAKLFGISEMNLYQPTYKKKLNKYAKKLVRAVWYEQEGIYKILNDERAREAFNCEIQSLVLFMLDEVPSKEQLAIDLGFNSVPALHAYLGQKTSAKTAMILVRACKHYRELVNEYDRQFATA